MQIELHRHCAAEFALTRLAPLKPSPDRSCPFETTLKKEEDAVTLLGPDSMQAACCTSTPASASYLDLVLWRTVSEDNTNSPHDPAFPCR
jgi:hypothetical protein